MKKKTFIKEGAYQKVPNNKGTTIKGALNLNKEVLDTLVDKDVLGTTDCCQYFPTIPEIVELRGQFNPSPEQTAHVPKWGLFIITDPDNENCASVYIKAPDGDNYIFVSLC